MAQTPVLSAIQTERMRALQAREALLVNGERELGEHKAKLAEFLALKPEMDALVQRLKTENAELDRKEAALALTEQAGGSQSLLQTMGLSQALSHENHRKLMALVDNYKWLNRPVQYRSSEDAENCFLSLTVDEVLMAEIYVNKQLLK